MGHDEIGIIVVCLLLPPLAAGLLCVLGRFVRWRPVRIPRGWRPLALVLALSASSSLLMAAFTVLRPDAVTAAPSVDDEDAEAAPPPGVWPIYVYELENWGESTRRDRTGQQFARAVAEHLKAAGLYVRRGNEHKVPLDLFQSDEPEEHIVAHYRKVVPFVSVWGYVSAKRDGSLEARVTVSRADAMIRPSELLARTLTFAPSADARDRAAETLSKEIIEMAKQW